MGMFDSIMLPCPKCGTLYEAQTKGGDCYLQVYSFEDAPQDAMGDVNRHAPFICDNCGTKFKVELSPRIVEVIE
jgi:hypothetical protein